MSVGGLVTVDHQRVGRGESAHVVSGAVLAARSRDREGEGGEGQRDEGGGEARHRGGGRDSPDIGPPSHVHLLTSATCIGLGWKLAQGAGGPGLCGWLGALAPSRYAIGLLDRRDRIPRRATSTDPALAFVAAAVSSLLRMRRMLSYVRSLDCSIHVISHRAGPADHRGGWSR